MGMETELKFETKDKENLLEALDKAGAEKISSGLEHNLVFDYRDGSLRENGLLLRLRRFNGRAVLTFKKGIRKGRFKEAQETETHVGDFSKAKEILLGLGYEVSWIYEKKRTILSLGNVKVCIDELPFGTFAEIEGDRRGITDAASKLGFDPSGGITKTYLELYRDYCKERGEEMENLIFWKGSR